MNKEKEARVLIVADYLYFNPEKGRADVLATFGEKWRISDRTMERIIKDAKTRNKERLSTQAEKVDKIIDKETEKYASKIVDRLEALSILSGIARGEHRKVTVEETDLEIITPSDSDRIRSLAQISTMEGWVAAIKQEIVVEQKQMTKTEAKKYLKSLKGG